MLVILMLTARILSEVSIALAKKDFLVQATSLIAYARRAFIQMNLQSVLTEMSARLELMTVIRMLFVSTLPAVIIVTVRTVTMDQVKFVSEDNATILHARKIKNAFLRQPFTATALTVSKKLIIPALIQTNAYKKCSLVTKVLIALIQKVVMLAVAIKVLSETEQLASKASVTKLSVLARKRKSVCQQLQMNVVVSKDFKWSTIHALTRLSVFLSRSTVLKILNVSMKSVATDVFVSMVTKVRIVRKLTSVNQDFINAMV